jgi:PAS domain S-box-containing protein
MGSAMANDEEKSKDELHEEIRSLREKIAMLRRKKTLSREQRLKLAIMERVPFTIWACDRNFKIVLWCGKCGDNYCCSNENAIGKNYLELFVDPPEREESREGCLKIIDEDIVMKNFLAYDKALDGSTKTMLTNCFRIFDEDSGEYLQAEVGIEISDLQLREREHRTLREAGIRRLAEKRQTVELLKENLTHKIDSIYSSKLDSIRRRRDQLNQYFEKIRTQQSEKEARSVTDLEFQKLDQADKALSEQCNMLRDSTQRAISKEELEQIGLRVEVFETQNPFPEGDSFPRSGLNGSKIPASRR